MHYILHFATLLVLFSSCSGPIDETKSDKALVQRELKKKRSFVVGHFKDQKNKDTIFVELIDSKSMEYVPEKLDVDWQTNLDLLVKRDTKLRMVFGDQSLLISDYEQVVGTSLLENLGDLDGDKLDEIGFVWHAEDYSMLNTYYIYSLSKGKLTEAWHFGIHDDMLVGSGPFIKKDKKGNFLFRSYDPIEGEVMSYQELKLAG